MLVNDINYTRDLIGIKFPIIIEKKYEKFEIHKFINLPKALFGNSTEKEIGSTIVLYKYYTRGHKRWCSITSKWDDLESFKKKLGTYEIKNK